MKNFRDDELFGELGNRLKDYSEKPDDRLWDDIADGLVPAIEGRWLPRIGYAAAAVLAGALVMVLLRNGSTSETGASTRDKIVSDQKAVTTELQKKTPSPIASTSAPSHRPRERQGPPSEAIPPPEGMNKNMTSNSGLNVTTIESSDPPRNMENAGTRSLAEATSREVSAEAVPKETQPGPDSVISAQPLPKTVKETIIPKTNQKTPGLMFYAMVTPSLSYQKIIPNANDNIIVSKFISAPVLSSARFGFAFDAGIQGQFTRRLEYYGGLSYYQQNQKLSYQYQSSDSVTTESSSSPNSFTVSPGTYNKEVDYSMKNVGVNAGVLYQLKGNKLTSKLGAGFMYQQGTAKIKNGETYDNSHSHYLCYQLFYRNELTITESIKLFVQPNFSYAMYSSERSAQPFKIKPYRAGLSFGMLCAL